jgi:Tfp pilus assembly protein FimT
MQKQVFKLSILILAVMMLLSCAQVKAWVQGTELTPAARYYDALVTFNRNVAQYLEVYKLSDKATQDKWKTQIDPAIKLASNALDSWKASLNTPTAPGKEQVWQDASKQLLAMLIAGGIIKIE